MDRTVVNVFEKGMVQDVDFSKIPQNKYFLAKDIAVYHKGAKTFVVTNIRGNIEVFQVTNNFVPIGYAVQRGIIYIFSANKDGSGEGEVGSYPYPDNGEFIRDYKPLQNLDGGDMRTDIFKFLPAHRLEVISKTYYDSSVNLYFTDANEVVRVVNNGFKDDGTVGDISYNSGTFETHLSLILYAKEFPYLNDFDVVSGGSFKYGSYIFYLRHKTKTMDTTTFTELVGLVPVFKGSEGDDDMEGGDAELRSDKKIVLDIKNIDSSYEYIEVAYRRSFSDYGGVAVHEYGIINKQFAITGTDMSIEITGNEGERLVTEQEMEMKPPEINTPKSITIVENRLWGANWKRKNVRHDLLNDFANKIKVRYGTASLPDKVWLNGNSDTQFKIVDNYKYIGYFSGETYAFGMVAELNDGTITQPYPLWGVDAFANNTPDYTVGGADKGNLRGIYRFPGPHQVPIHNSGHVTVLSVILDFTDAMNSVMENEDNAWIRFNVKAIHFVRTDRFKNLQAQGLMMMASKPFIEDGTSPAPIPTEDASIDGQFIQYMQDDSGNTYYDYTQRKFSADEFYDNEFWGRLSYPHAGSTNDDYGRQFPEKYAPIYRGYAPAFKKDAGNLDHSPNANYLTRVFLKSGKYGFYSPEILFNELNATDNFNYVYRIGKTIYKHSDIVANSPTGNIHDNYGLWEHSIKAHTITTPNEANFPTRVPLWEVVAVKPEALLYNDERIIAIDNKIMIGEESLLQPGNDGYFDFINAADEPYSSVENTWFWSKESDEDPFGAHHQDSNRSFVLAKYVGIDINESLTAVNDYDNYNLDIVNIYKTNPNSVNILDYSTLSENYFFIGHPVYMEDLIGYVKAGTIGLHSEVIYDGDCFTQRFYFRQMQWGGSKFLYGLGNANWDDINAEDRPTMDDPIKYSFGIDMGFIVQSSINTALRGKYKDHSYWPNEDPDWIVGAYPDKKENFAMNKGYSDTDSDNSFRIYNKDDIYSTLDFIATIAYSDKDIAGSIADPFRVFRSANRKDFSMSHGPINKLAVYMDNLISIQDDAINQHYVNERIVMGKGEENVYGYGDVLADKTRMLAEYGSQHQFSIVETQTGVYGMDWKRGIIWNVTGKYGSTGSFYLVAVDITEQQLIKTWTEKVINDAVGGYTDRSTELRDDTINGSGLVAGYDPDLGNIYFTYMFRE